MFLPVRRPASPVRALLLITVLGIALVSASCQRSQASALLADAARQRAAGKTAAALFQINRALRENDADRHARLLLGETYLDHDSPAEAELALRRAAAVGADPVRLPLLLGQALLMQGKYWQLLAELPEEGNPATRPARLSLRGQAFLGLDRVDEARDAFGAALALQGARPDALLGQARLALAQGRQGAAASLAERALAADPANLASLRFQADLLRAQGQGAAALAVNEAMLLLRPQARTLIDMAAVHTDAGQFARAHAALVRAQQLGGPTPALLYAQAAMLVRARQPAAALAALQQRLQAAPDDAPARLLAGAVLAAQGETAEAAAHVHAFLARHPRHPYATRLLAALRVRTGDAEGALALLAPLLRAHPDDAALLTLAGEARLHGRQFEAAATLFEQAAAQRPVPASVQAALVLSRLGGGASSRAIAELERADLLAPHSVGKGILLVMTQLRARAPDKALAALRAMERTDNNALLQNLKGTILLAASDEAGARASFEQALALEPLYLPALSHLAQLDLRANRAGAARKRYEAALRRAPRNTALMDALSALARDQGDTRAALAWMERAYRLEPQALARGLRVVDLALRAGEYPPAPPAARIRALGLARALTAAHPASPDALARLAEAQALAGQRGGALDTYARLATLAPRLPAPHVQMASLHLAGGNRQAALLSLRHALAIDPDRVDAQRGLLALLIAQKEYDAAAALAASVQRRQPRSPAGYRLEGDLLAARADHPAALAAYERAFALDQQGELLVQLHGALARLGRAGEADARVAAWLAQHPRDIPARLYFGASLLARGDLAGAIAALGAVLDLDADNVAALNTLARACELAAASRAHLAACSPRRFTGAGPGPAGSGPGPASHGDRGPT